MEKIQTLGSEIRSARLHIVSLRQKADDPASSQSSHDLLAQTIQELETNMEELEVAEEELREQNEELLLSRQALEAERQRYQELFEFAPDAYLVTDSSGMIKEANRAATEILRAPQEYLLEKPLALFFTSPEDRHEFRCFLNDLLADKVAPERDLQMSAYSGSHPFRAAMKVAVQRDSGGAPVSLRWLIRDITFRVGAEDRIRRLNIELEERRRELERLLKRQREFINLVAGDLKSPIKGISDFAQAIDRYVDHPETVRGYVADIVATAKRMNYMVSDLEEMGSMEAGGRALQVRPLHVGFFASELLQRLEGALETRRIRLAMPNGLPLVLADPDRLEHILTNLLRNSLKHSKRQVTVRAKVSGRDITVSVTDHRSGIPDAELRRDLESFGEAGSDGFSEGLDLGLHVAGRLVEAHGGRVRTESQAGKGATFCFTLPLA